MCICLILASAVDNRDELMACGKRVTEKKVASKCSMLCLLVSLLSGLAGLWLYIRLATLIMLPN